MNQIEIESIHMQKQDWCLLVETDAASSFTRLGPGDERTN